MKYLFFLIFSMAFFQCKNTQSMDTENVKIHAFRLKPNQDLKKEIEAFVKKEKIEAGWIMTCVGSLTQSNIRFANQPEGAKSNGHFEIVSLVGTVSVNGSHIHLSMSDSLGKTTGGHLLEGNLIYTTAEIVIGESRNHTFNREKDGSTPWEELQVKTKKN
ncbi:MAG: DNA-binding protein, partial [Spirosomaceae bacterium]|nr:DNA-binding protein [Spirosomataceae bacterium]